MTERTELGFPRTVCACENCVTNCEFMPGFLIPSDLERMIPDFMKPLPWAEMTLLASPGALVMKHGQTFRIPTLVPAVKPDGSCIHLMPDKSCGIHPVAPFGCAYFDCGPERGNLSQYGLIQVYQAWQDHTSLYRRIWHHLFDMGKTQHKAEVLRILMEATLEHRRLVKLGWTGENFVEALKNELKGETK